MTNAIGDYANSMVQKGDTSWQDGGLNKTALNGLAGLIEAKVAGGSAVAGIVSGVVNEKLVGAMGDYLESQGIHEYNKDGSLNPDFASLMQLGSSLAGAAAGALAGGNVQSAALGQNVALTATQNNRLLHENEKKKIKELANGDPELERQLTNAACYLVHCSAGKGDDDPAKANMQALEQTVAANVNGEYTVALALLLKAQNTTLFNYTAADQRLDQLNAVDPRSVLGGLSLQEQNAKEANLLACREVTSCITDVNNRYDRIVSDRVETTLTILNAQKAHDQCQTTECRQQSLAQMQGLLNDLKAQGADVLDSARIGLSLKITQAAAALGEMDQAAAALAAAVVGITVNEAGGGRAKGEKLPVATAADAKGGTAILGGELKPLTTNQIIEINQTTNGGGVPLTGSVDTVIANMSYREGFSDQAATVIRDIAGSHLFQDGNKRTAQAVVETFAQQNGIPIDSQALRQIIDEAGKGSLGNLSTVESISQALKSSVIK
jgi:hypothetical protein